MELKIINTVEDEPTLESAQEFVGGMVQGIEFPNGDYMIMNEEGKLMGLPVNEPATKLWRKSFTKVKKSEWILDSFFFSPNRMASFINSFRTSAGNLFIFILSRFI